jgi:hypothetical protein
MERTGGRSEDNTRRLARRGLMSRGAIRQKTYIMMTFSFRRRFLLTDTRSLLRGTC